MCPDSGPGGPRDLVRTRPASHPHNPVPKVRGTEWVGEEGGRSRLCLRLIPPSLPRVCLGTLLFGTAGPRGVDGVCRDPLRDSSRQRGVTGLLGSRHVPFVSRVVRTKTLHPSLVSGGVDLKGEPPGPLSFGAGVRSSATPILETPHPAFTVTSLNLVRTEGRGTLRNLRVTPSVVPLTDRHQPVSDRP